MSVYRTWFIEQLAGRDETTFEMKLANMWASAAWYESQKNAKNNFKSDIDSKINDLYNHLENDSVPEIERKATKTFIKMLTSMREKYVEV